MQKYVKCLFSLVGLLLSQHAFAENWQGIYIGADISYVKAYDIGKEYDLDGTYNSWKQDIKPEGIGLGLHVGNNTIVNDRFLFGVEANYKIYDVKDTAFQYKVTDGHLCDDNGAECTFKSKLDQSASILARVGYLINEKTLIYAVGGYSAARLERKLYDGWDQLKWMSYKKWQNGWTAGAGLEYMLLNSVGVKAEYRHTDLGAYSYYTPAYGGQYEKQKYHQNEISLGLNYHF